MIKKLLFLFSILLGVTSYQSKIIAHPTPLFFCDTFAPTNFQITNITPNSVSVSWTLDPNTPDYILRIRPVGAVNWLLTFVQTNSPGNYTFAGLMSCTNYEVQVAKVCAPSGTWSNIISFTTLSNGVCILALYEIQKNQKIAIYPNPASDILNITGVKTDEDFEMYSEAGQKVSSGIISDHQINVHQLLKGVYFLQIEDSGKLYRLKFIKK